MDNVELEKERTDVVDQQPIVDSTLLPEQPRIPQGICPTIFDLDHWIHTWQPMGIRVIVNLPYFGDDATPLFYIRANPFIPYYQKIHNSYIYTLSNTLPVVMGTYKHDLVDSDLGIQITHYDNPPPLAVLSRSFRRWRGSLQYRIRTVGNFTQQAYLQAWPVYNKINRVGIHDPYTYNLRVDLKDATLMEGMLNSYVMSDLSFQRHLELQMPYQYPTQYFDQFQWLDRCVTVPQYSKDTAGNITLKTPPHSSPTGENFIALSVRGAIAAQTTGQITFELEYRGGDDFQFADPFLLDRNFNLGITAWRDDSKELNRLFSWPDKTLTSDGISTVTKKTTMVDPIDTTELDNLLSSLKPL